MTWIIGDQNYNPDGMVAFQAARRTELRYGAPPATGLKDNWFQRQPRPVVTESPLRPMSEAPRDGTELKLHRRPHPNLKHPVITAYWKQWSAHHGFWNHATLGPIGGDEVLIGWEAI